MGQPYFALQSHYDPVFFSLPATPTRLLSPLDETVPEKQCFEHKANKKIQISFTAQSTKIDNIYDDTITKKIKKGNVGVGQACPICKFIIVKQSYPYSKLVRVCQQCYNLNKKQKRVQRHIAEAKTCTKCNSNKIVKLWLNNKDPETDYIEKICESCYRKNIKNTRCKNLSTSTSGERSSQAVRINTYLHTSESFP